MRKSALKCIISNVKKKEKKYNCHKLGRNHFFFYCHVNNRTCICRSESKPSIQIAVVPWLR